MKLKDALFVIATIAILALAMFGCSSADLALRAKMNGEGWMPSTSTVHSDKATFHFSAEKQGAKSVLGHFTFEDKHSSGFPTGGVKMNGTIVDAGECVQDENGQFLVDACQQCGPDFGYAIEVEYESTNPGYPGPGSAFACFKNNAEGTDAAVKALGALVITKGPYTDYSNHGPVKGSIHFHNYED